MNVDVKSMTLGPMQDCLYWVEIGFMLDVTVTNYSMDLVFKSDAAKIEKIKTLDPIVIDDENGKYIKLCWFDNVELKKDDEVYFHIQAKDSTTTEITTNPNDIYLNVKGYHVLWM